MSKFNELVTKLREIFQIDRPELDFGVYRILNARADEINDYLENRLKEKVTEALSAKAKGDTESITKDLIAELREEYGKRAFDDNGNLVDEEALASDTGKRLLDILNSSKGVADNENAVFSHLLTFFSRYYDQGDFISQRRYKGDTYAIPYAGEEVMLHWANKDQYYIKSGENFSNYSFKLEDGRIVHFRLVAADTAKDNRKDNDKDRLFVLAENRTIVRTDDDGDEYDDEIIPIEQLSTTDADGNTSTELVIRFDYKAVSKGTKQDKLISEAVASALELDWVASNWSELSSRAPTEKNPKRTLLEKHLINYTAKNTADYFIHKNLGKFLRGELDFYIKNEVMNLDDVQDAEAFSDIEKNLRMIQCLRSISIEIIGFLTQIENFQKKIWLKRKFITNCDYAISLGLLDAEIQNEILKNDVQISEWISLGMIKDEDDLLSGNFDVSKLIVDTRNIDLNLKHSIISDLEDIDANTSAVMIHADNFQALNILQEKYREKVDCIHIDPPYNTATSGFLYKNNYKHSSWLTLMQDRVSLSSKLLSEDGDFICHIDENEYERLDLLLDSNGLSDHGTIIWDKKNPMLGRKGIATQHEYVNFRSRSERIVNGSSPIIKQMFNKVEELKNKFLGDHNKIQKEYSSWLSKQKDFSGGDRAYKYISDDYRIYRLVAMGAPERRSDPKFHIALIHPETGLACPVPPNGWSRAPETLKELIDQNLIVFGKDHTTQPQKVVFLRVDGKKQVTSVISDGKSGKSYLDELNLEFPYCHPVSLYEQLLSTRTEKSIFMDFFAGSGTNGHAVLNLSREHNVKHHQILVEVGSHFDDVLVPRMKKLAFSSTWSSGFPDAETGDLQIYKIVKLESYEDSLNNLTIRRLDQQKSLLDNNRSLSESFKINYMLDFDSRSSIINTTDFLNPFEYRMNISTDSSGAYRSQEIDLIETFNFLIGIAVKHYEYNIDQGYVRIEGLLPSGEKALILWRDCEKVDYEKLREWENRLNIGAKDNPYDVIYINGDHNLSEIYSPTKKEGGETSVRVIRSIEPEFLSRMFAEEEI